jgi:hypothetical protein
MSTAAKPAQDSGVGTDAGDTTPRALMPHFTVKQIAELWRLSDDAVRNIFAGEEGVLAIGGERKPGTKRKSYVTLRIPLDVVERVHRRRSKA